MIQALIKATITFMIKKQKYMYIICICIYSTLHKFGNPKFYKKSHYITAIYTCFWFKCFVRHLNDDKHLPRILKLVHAENMLDNYFTISKCSKLNFVRFGLLFICILLLVLQCRTCVRCIYIGYLIVV